jgi:hypothetical protein
MVQDRIDSNLRKQELEEARRAQERLIISSDDNRIKAIKQAQSLYKKFIIEAEDIRSKTIQQAYSDEKSMIREAKNKLKTEKKALKTKPSDKLKQRMIRIGFHNPVRANYSRETFITCKISSSRKTGEIRYLR